MLLAPEKFAPEEILTILQTGIVACKVATRLCEIISNQLEPPKFTTRAKVGTFFARDNAANFLTWCKLIGVSDPPSPNQGCPDQNRGSKSNHIFRWIVPSYSSLTACVPVIQVKKLRDKFFSAFLILLEFSAKEKTTLDHYPILWSSNM